LCEWRQSSIEEKLVPQVGLAENRVITCNYPYSQWSLITILFKMAQVYPLVI